MDEKVQQSSPKKMNESNMNLKLKVPDINLDEFEKQAQLLVSPRARPTVTKSASTRWSCLCSPTTHAGSFRCRHHRGSGLHRGHSVGSNLLELAHKSSGMSDSLEAQ